jgi:endonuclease/exonuclease/phosphatase family metal-dependent hydrolase
MVTIKNGSANRNGALFSGIILTRCTQKIFRFCAAGLITAAVFLAGPVSGQILMSGGTYAQNFDALASSGTVNWTNNVTLRGWYAAKGSADATTCIASTGTGSMGGIYSFGTNGVNPVSDRALGSIASSSTAYTYGVRFTNDTALTQTNITISYTGEQWRNANGAGAVTNILAFSFQVASAPLTNADAANLQTWTASSALDFNSPVVNTGGSGTALDGNATANRQIFTNIVLSGTVVQPGQEIFLRWRDTDDSGSDAGMAIDNLTVSFQSTNSSSMDTNPPPVSFSTNSTITLMTYNVKGNGVADWSTNTAQVQAIGRELVYLKPDIITFNEIPYTNTWQMANWVTAFLPGYFLATNSGTDGFIRSVIASRFPINRSQSWLSHANLNPFGYTNNSSQNADNFTRDLFEAEINVPNWPLPLHVFTTHLKSDSGTTYADAAAKRAAEAAAITNFFATNFFVLSPAHPFTLSGDLNDSDTNMLAIQRLISAPTTLRLTNPTNPFTGSINTYSIQGSVSERIDFIFPSALLVSNIIGGQVFRTDLLTNFPANLFSNDDKTASDHLPVLMTFANPFDTPFKLLSIAQTNQNVTLKWESQNNRNYSIEASTDLVAWTLFATNLATTTTNATYAFTSNNVRDRIKFFRIYRVP